MIREKSYKNPGEPSTAALLANASGRPDFLISNAIPEKSWLPERDNRITPHPVTYQRQAPSGLPPYMGHSLTGERLMGERLLDGSQPFSGNFVALGSDRAKKVLNDFQIEQRPVTGVAQPLTGVAPPLTGVTPQLFNILVTPRVPFRVDTDPGSTPGYRIKSGMTRGA